MKVSLPKDVTHQLARLLEDIEVRAGDEFSGIGLIVTASPELLPIVPLRPSSIIELAEPVADALARISNVHDEHHDGFHVLTPDFRITLIAQYFSPPISPDAQIDRRKRFGGRYLAALFGSALPGVLATGISSRDFGMAIFQDNWERLHRAMPRRTLGGGATAGGASV